MKRTLTTPQKLLASVAVVATSGALTAGAFAAWTTTDSQHQDIGTALVSSEFTQQNGDADWTDLDVTNFVAGQTYQDYGRLTNNGSIEQTFTLNVTGRGDGHLTATEGGMQVRIQKCAVAWSEAGTCSEPADVQPFAYITNGGITSPTIQLSAGIATYLRFDFNLPDDDVATFQDKGDRFVVTETGVVTGHMVAASPSPTSTP